MIAPSEQHKGYGRAAMKAFIELAKVSDKFDMLSLDYVEGNTAARELYYSVGFRENGDVEDDEIIMTLPLTDSPKVGFTTADDDDIDELSEVYNDCTAKPFGFDTVKAAIGEGRVQRFTLMGDAIGFALDGVLMLLDEYADRKNEILNTYKMFF